MCIDEPMKLSRRMSYKLARPQLDYPSLLMPNYQHIILPRRRKNTYKKRELESQKRRKTKHPVFLMREYSWNILFMKSKLDFGFKK